MLGTLEGYVFLFLIACDPGSIQGEAGQVTLDDDDFMVGAFSSYQSGDPVALGAELCPELDCVGCEADSDDFVDCFAVVEDDLDEGACLSFDSEGAYALNFLALGCEQLPDAVDDVVHFDVVADLTPRLEFPYAELALAANDEDETQLRHHELAAFPEDILPTTLQVLEGEAVLARVVLETAEGDRAAYTRSQHLIGVDGGEELGHDERNGIYIRPEGPGSVVFDGDEAGTFAVVAEDDIVSLEVHIGVFTSNDEETPMAARAIARTADGEQVFGLPVVWSVTGTDLALAGTIEDEIDFEDTQTVFLTDECIASDGSERQSQLIASWNGHEAVADVRWVKAVDEADFVPNEDCLDGQDFGPDALGCGQGCASGPALPGLAALLLGLAITRRRREA